MVQYAATATVIPYVERKDPQDQLEWTWDWASWLEAGETLASVAWEVPTGITQDSDDILTTSAKLWLSGGTAGETYTIACIATTNMNRVAKRSCRILVAER